MCNNSLGLNILINVIAKNENVLYVLDSWRIQRVYHSLSEIFEYLIQVKNSPMSASIIGLDLSAVYTHLGITRSTFNVILLITKKKTQ